MAYIGNHHSPFILGPNVRTDIIPDNSTNTFDLNQEVPGGSEENVCVIRRRFIEENLLNNSTAVAFTAVTNIISFSDTSASSIAGRVQKAIPNVRPPDYLKISGASNAQNNSGSGYFTVLDVSTNGSGTSIVVDHNLISESSGSSVTIKRGVVGNWEVLEPEIDYTIGGSGIYYNKQITFTDTPQETDLIYVIHKGEATYNFVPSQASVGPDQLQQNLRNFTLDKFTGNGSNTDFTLTQTPVSGKSIVVSVDGVVKDPKDDDNPANSGDYYISGATLTFAVAPSNSTKIRVLHLGFSTVSRRAALSPSQVGAVADGSITETKIANTAVTESKLATNAVTTTKIANNAVTHAKILLDNNQYLNGKNSGGSSVGIIKIDSLNNVHINSAGNVNVNNKVTVESSSILPVTSNAIDLGSSSYKFKDAHLQGNLNAAGNVNVTGNVVVGGTVDGIDIAALSALVSSLQSEINAMKTNAIGEIVAHVTDGTVPTFTDRLLCDGSVYSTTTYANLYAKIGTQYNTGSEGAGNFRIPNIKGRSLVGRDSSGAAAGWGAVGGVFGSLNHTHTTPAHTHDLANHTHSVSGHYHEQDIGNGSTLAVSTSSGSHTTAIDHNHGSATTSGTAVTVTVDPVASHTHSINAATTGITVTSTNSAHQHNTTARSSDSGTSPLTYIKSTGGGGTAVTVDIPRSTTDGAHTHTISDPGHGHSASSNGAHGHSASSPSHTHSVAIPLLVGNSPSDGKHVHSASEISGSIGNVTSGNNGNNGFNTGAPNTNSTSSDGAGTTSTANHSCFVTYFFIKI